MVYLQRVACVHFCVISFLQKEVFLSVYIVGVLLICHVERLLMFCVIFYKNENFSLIVIILILGLIHIFGSEIVNSEPLPWLMFINICAVIDIFCLKGHVIQNVFMFFIVDIDLEISNKEVL